MAGVFLLLVAVKGVLVENDLGWVHTVSDTKRLPG